MMGLPASALASGAMATNAEATAATATAVTTERARHERRPVKTSLIVHPTFLAPPFRRGDCRREERRACAFPGLGHVEFDREPRSPLPSPAISRRGEARLPGPLVGP